MHTNREPDLSAVYQTGIRGYPALTLFTVHTNGPCPAPVLTGEKHDYLNLILALKWMSPASVDCSWYFSSTMNMRHRLFWRVCPETTSPPFCCYNMSQTWRLAWRRGITCDLLIGRRHLIRRLVAPGTPHTGQPVWPGAKGVQPLSGRTVVRICFLFTLWFKVQGQFCDLVPHKGWNVQPDLELLIFVQSNSIRIVLIVKAESCPSWYRITQWWPFW